MSGYVQSNQVVTLPSLILSTISLADTGKIIMTPQTAGGITFIYALPSPAAGLHYRFINGAAAALNGAIAVTATTPNIVFGSIIMGPTGGVALQAVNGSTVIGFTSAVSLLGDYMDFTSDGTNWYIDARSRLAGGISVA